MHTVFAAARRELCFTLKYTSNVVRHIQGRRQGSLNLYRLLVNTPWAVQYHTSRVALNLNTVSTPSYQLNCDIHILTNDGMLNVYAGPFDRAKICREHVLEPRHLQRIDTDLSVNVPKIDICAGKYICFSSKRHRGILKHNQCLFFAPIAKSRCSASFDSNDKDSRIKIAQNFTERIQYIYEKYNQQLRAKNQSNLSLKYLSDASFELQMMEIIFDSMAHNFNSWTQELKNKYKSAQERVYTRITIDLLRELALLKVDVDKHKRNGDLTHKAITDLLARDRDLSGMYLTKNHKTEISDQSEAQLTLEVCAKRMAEVCRAIYDLEDSLHALETATGFLLDAV